MLQLINHVRDGDFSVEENPRPGQTKKFEDKEFEALLDEVAESLGVTQQSVSVLLKSMGMIHKQGNWLP